MAREDRERNLAALPAVAADISLIGPVDEAMAARLRDALAAAEDIPGILTVDLTTLGGDPEMARRMIADLDAARARLSNRRLVLVGKTAVYSAGCTFMAGFPRADRYLTADTVLLIHCRQASETITFDGPIRAHIARLKAKLHEYETGVALESDNFARLIADSSIEMSELLEKAYFNWYVPAEEAIARGLVAGILPDRPAAPR